MRRSFPSPGLSDLPIPRSLFYLAISPLANCLKLGDQERGEDWIQCRRWPRAGPGAPSPSFAPGAEISPRRESGVPTPVFRDFPRGPRSDVRGRHIFSGFWLPRGVGEQLVGRESAAPRQERLERFSSGKPVPRPARRRLHRARTAPVLARARGLQRVARPARRG